MKYALVCPLMVAAGCPVFLNAQQPREMEPAQRIEVRIATLVNTDRDAVDPCEVNGATIGANYVTAWSTVGQARPSGESGWQLRDSSLHCGSGATPSTSLADPAPFVILEISAAAGFAPGAMDPGPAGAVQLSFTVTSRRLTGFGPDRRPIYSNPVIDRRTIRFEEGEDFILPVMAADDLTRDALGVQDMLLRIRAGWAGRKDATEYGAIRVMGAAPGSEILLDGGVVGRAGADGSFLLAGVPVGQREVRLRGVPGPVVSRTVLVAKGRNFAVSPESMGTGTPPQPAVTLAGKNSQGSVEYHRARDGAIMVHIPGGEFLMGNLHTEGSPLPHKVDVSSFLIDKLPVTVGLFKRFAAATGHPLPPDPYWGVHDDFAVAFVRWDEAKKYCEWAGGRLPTEAEREKATRGTDGRMWPWGNEPPPTPERAVFRKNWGEEGNDKVGIRPAGASPYGLLDTGGNMWEWCEDWWQDDYFQASPPKDPPGPKTGTARVVKGGSWDSRPTVLSASSRNFGYTGYREGDFGFRCAADPPR